MFLTSLGVCVLCLEAQAETFYLKNGDIVEGRVVDEDETRLKLEDAVIKAANDHFTMPADVFFIPRDQVLKNRPAGALKSEFFGPYAREAREKYQLKKRRQYYMFGLAWAARGDFDKATSAFQKSLRVDEFFTPARQAMELIHDVRDEKIEYQTAHLMFQAATTSGLEELFRYLTRIVAQAPAYPMARTLLGIGYLRARHWDKAMDEFQEVKYMVEKNGPAHNNIGVVYARQRQFERAKKEFNRALLYDPHLQEAEANLDLAFRMQNLTERTQELNETPDFDDMAFEDMFSTCSILAF